MSSSSFAVVGAGSWGTALALLLARNAQKVRLWSRDKPFQQEMQQLGRNPRFLMEYAFPKNLVPCLELAQALQGAKDVLVAVPSEGFLPTLQQIKPFINSEMRIFWGTKGLIPGTNQLLHVALEEIFGKKLPYAVLSGPSFAKEVAAGLPTAVTIASSNEEFAKDLCQRFHNETFRPYQTTDVIGVEIGGAVKNVLAIGAGISDGLGYGANSRSALIARALVEMVRLGVAVGGQAQTLYGLAGLGDLILTATHDQSRNRRLGLALGKGLSLEDALAQIGQCVEGVSNCIEVFNLSKKYQVEMPIVEQVFQVIHQQISPKIAVNTLLSRDLKSESF